MFSERSVDGSVGFWVGGSVGFVGGMVGFSVGFSVGFVGGAVGFSVGFSVGFDGLVGFSSFVVVVGCVLLPLLDGLVVFSDLGEVVASIFSVTFSPFAEVT